MEGHLHTSLRIPYISILSLLHLRSPFDYLPTTCISLRFIICNKVSIYIYIHRWLDEPNVISRGVEKKLKKKKEKTKQNGKIFFYTSLAKNRN